MTRVDRYIVAEFLRVFAICFVTFLGLFVVADFVNNLDELMRHGKHHGGLAKVLLGHYGPKVPWFFDLIGRIVALVAAIFAITSLQRNQEMAAMMAAGVSRWRIVKPLVYCVAFIALAGVVNRELIIPNLGATILRDAKNYAGDQSEVVRGQYDHATGVFVEGSGIVHASKTIEQPRFHIPAELAPRGTRIEATTARHIPAEGDRPTGFLLAGVRSSELGVKRTLKLEDQVVVYHPLDYDWLKSDQMFLATDLPFNQLIDGNNWRHYASTFSLIAGARNASLDSGAGVSVTIHTRLLQPVVDMLLLFLGLPVVLSRESRNAFIAVGSTMLVISLFVVANLVLQSMGIYYRISPSLAVWSPLMVFIPLAVLMSGPLSR